MKFAILGNGSICCYYLFVSLPQVIGDEDVDPNPRVPAVFVNVKINAKFYNSILPLN